ncbi:MAG: hypothetical protein AAGF11_31780 [Myxococcota bacterium]
MYAELEILWNYSASALLTPLVWGIGIGLAALVGLLVLWVVLGRQGWLRPPSGRTWPGSLVLVLWVLALVPLAGVGGLAYGAQRATVNVLEQSNMIAGSCEALARSLVRIAAAGADPTTTPERISVVDLRALWDGTGARIDRLEDRGIDAVVSSGSSEDGTAEATALVARWGLDALRAELLSEHAEAIEPIVGGLEAHAAADGTVGAPEAAAWLADEYLAPIVRAFIVGLFRPYYQLAWGCGVLGVVLPLVVLGLWRRLGRGAAAAAVVPTVARSNARSDQPGVHRGPVTFAGSPTGDERVARTAEPHEIGSLWPPMSPRTVDSKKIDRSQSKR